jgi:hypothetical protein
MKQMLALLALAVCAGLVFQLSAQNPVEKLGPRLVSLMKNLDRDQTALVWVTFTDKGTRLSAKHLEATERLTERALKRRSKMRAAPDLVTFKDYALEGTYVQTVRSTVKRVRNESRWFNALSVEATQEQIERLAALPFVHDIELVVRMKKRAGEEQTPWGESPTGIKEIMDTLNYGTSYTQVNQIQVPAVHNTGNYGQGVVVAVFDAGFNNLSHPAFSTMNILATHDFVNGDSSVGDDGDMGSGSHGTNTLSVLGGYASGQLIGPAFGASFVLAKTENTESETPIEEDNWIAAIEWAEMYGVDVISSSLGYITMDPGSPYSYDWTWMNGDSCRITIGADMATWEGIVVVNSAGNEGDNISHNTLGAPADGDTVIAAGAVNSSGTRVSFSSVGPTVDGRIKPDVMAMGSGVKAATGFPGSTGYSSVSGTSFSCPLTAGVCALILSANPLLTPFQVREALRTTGSNSSNPDKYYGWGIVRALDAVDYYRAVFTHTPLVDTEDPVGPYTITAQVTSTLPLVADSLRLYYGTEGAFTASALLAPTGNPNEYSAQIPAQGSNVNINYYLSAVNTSGIRSSLPADAPASYFSFHVGADVLAPVIVHAPLGNQGLFQWPPTVSADVTDNLGVDSVIVEYLYNGVPQDPFLLVRQGLTSTYAANFPLPSVNLNDLIEYRIRARDAASVPNVAMAPASGYYSFRIGSLSVFSNDLNASDGGFVGVNEWQWGAPSGPSPLPHSSPNLWATILGGNYSDDQYSTLTLPEMVAASGTASVSFWQAYDFELNWDGGNVKASVNGGPFNVIAPVGGYPIAALNNGNPMAGQPAFSGTHLTWEQKTFSLSGVASTGDRVQLRLDAGSDNSVVRVGWYVDDFSAVDLGSVVVDVHADETSRPFRFDLLPNYPNPFNPSTTLAYALPITASVTLRVYNVLGQSVRTLLLNKRQAAGRYTLVWDGKDETGRSAASGVYIYRLTTDAGVHLARKMTLIK